jgi:hypothetical protein
MTDMGSRFVSALATKDTAALVELFAADLDFRGLTPGRFWEAATPTDLVENVLYEWFGPADVVESVQLVESGQVVDRSRVDYRFTVRNGDGLHSVEQRAYFDLDDSGRIARMHAMCSGFRPLPAGAGGS